MEICIALPYCVWAYVYAAHFEWSERIADEQNKRAMKMHFNHAYLLLAWLLFHAKQQRNFFAVFCCYTHICFLPLSLSSLFSSLFIIHLFFASVNFLPCTEGVFRMPWGTSNKKTVPPGIKLAQHFWYVQQQQQKTKNRRRNCRTWTNYRYLAKILLRRTGNKIFHLVYMREKEEEKQRITFIL